MELEKTKERSRDDLVSTSRIRKTDGVELSEKAQKGCWITIANKLWSYGKARRRAAAVAKEEKIIAAARERATADARKKASAEARERDSIRACKLAAEEAQKITPVKVREKAAAEDAARKKAAADEAARKKAAAAEVARKKAVAAEAAHKKAVADEAARQYVKTNFARLGPQHAVDIAYQKPTFDSKKMTPTELRDKAAADEAACKKATVAEAAYKKAAPVAAARKKPSFTKIAHQNAVDLAYIKPVVGAKIMTPSELHNKAAADEAARKKAAAAEAAGKKAAAAKAARKKAAPVAPVRTKPSFAKIARQNAVDLAYQKPVVDAKKMSPAELRKKAAAAEAARKKAAAVEAARKKPSFAKIARQNAVDLAYKYPAVSTKKVAPAKGRVIQQ